MNVKIYPSKAEGKAIAPPSKSVAHRALICGALSGRSVIDNVAFSKDVTATLNCLSALGAGCSTDNDSVTLGGLNAFDPNESIVLDCFESGSTLRFLIPLCLISGKEITLKGANRLFERPLSIYEAICREQGMLFEKNENSVTLCGPLKSGNYRVNGDVSSQFISGLLFALPLLDGVSIVEIVGKLESASYVDITLGVLSDFGIKITRVGNRFIILGNQRYQGREYTVEGDYSNAAFLDAFNLIGGNVELCGLSHNTLQGDAAYKKIFEGLENGKKNFDLSDCPDLAPVLFALAAVKGGATFTGTARLKIKESDRGEAMARELKKFGVPVTVGENHVEIGSTFIKAPTETLFGHNDHRIVMALAVLCSIVGGEIQGAEAISKSYPDFFKVIQQLNIGLSTDEN